MIMSAGIRASGETCSEEDGLKNSFHAVKRGFLPLQLPIEKIHIGVSVEGALLTLSMSSGISQIAEIGSASSIIKPATGRSTRGMICGSIIADLSLFANALEAWHASCLL